MKEVLVAKKSLDLIGDISSVWKGWTSYRNIKKLAPALYKDLNHLKEGIQDTQDRIAYNEGHNWEESWENLQLANNSLKEFTDYIRDQQVSIKDDNVNKKIKTFTLINEINRYKIPLEKFLLYSTVDDEVLSFDETLCFRDYVRSLDKIYKNLNNFEKPDEELESMLCKLENKYPNSKLMVYEKVERLKENKIKEKLNTELGTYIATAFNKIRNNPPYSSSNFLTYNRWGVKKQKLDKKKPKFTFVNYKHPNVTVECECKKNFSYSKDILKQANKARKKDKYRVVCYIIDEILPEHEANIKKFDDNHFIPLLYESRTQRLVCNDDNFIASFYSFYFDNESQPIKLDEVLQYLDEEEGITDNSLKKNLKVTQEDIDEKLLLKGIIDFSDEYPFYKLYGV